jgi:glucosamine--fructose-6-phosphate aminotransferase (isomerizing)
MNPYIQDILSQPQAVRDACRYFSTGALTPLAQRLRQNEFDRILITGMGASYHAAYPATLHLSRQPTPVMWVNAAELLHYSQGFLGERTLLWLNSQSGQSAELVHLVEQAGASPPACILACVNDTSSPVAGAADVCLPIHAGPEATVSTRTYLNMLAVNLLIAISLTGGDTASAIEQLNLTADAIENYLLNWQSRTEELNTLLGPVHDLVILGRGASMAAVWYGSLINKEAAKCAFEGLNAADFRHGPLELVSPNLAVMIFEGAKRTARLNRDLALDVMRFGGQVLWIAPRLDAALPTLLLPEASDFCRPLIEALPMQMLTIVMASRKSIEPGIFRYVGKITRQE